MIAAALQLIAWSAAFWLALWLHARQRSPGSARFALALLLGAGLSRVGFAALWGRAPEWLDASEGVSVLFVPLGPLLLRAGPAAFASLSLPLAVARLGCLAAGCCRGIGGECLPLFEAVGLVMLHALLAGGTLEAAPERFAWAFGALRLAESPWRPRAAAPLVDVTTPEGVACAWLLVGTLLAWRRSVTNSGRFLHASVTCPPRR